MEKVLPVVSTNRLINRKSKPFRFSYLKKGYPPANFFTPWKDLKISSIQIVFNKELSIISIEIQIHFFLADINYYVNFIRNLVVPQTNLYFISCEEDDVGILTKNEKFIGRSFLS